MLKLIGFCLKIVIFSALILILGNMIRWDGKTISDQVKLKMSHAERSPFLGTVKSWAEKLTHDAKEEIHKGISFTERPSAQEKIHSSERQKLKALIEELNNSQKED